MSASSERQENRLIISLDFGTTYSGQVFDIVDTISAIGDWPGAQGRKAWKAPTAIKYTGNNSLKWGFDVENDLEQVIHGFKLLLDPEQTKPIYDPMGVGSVSTELKRLGKSAVDVSSDYMRAIYEHSLKEIESRIPREYFAQLEREYVLTVPAVWSDKTRDATRRAARNAGITPVKMISEPEAAALFTLNQLKNLGLEDGDALTICDAGGGTVDLVSYEINQLEPLQIKMIAPPSGGLAGSILVNKRFEQWVRDKVGENTFYSLKGTSAYKRGMRYFDQAVKPGFGCGDDEEEHYINFPMAHIEDDPANGIRANTLILTSSELHDIFLPVVQEVDRLVKYQIDSVRLARLQNQHPKGATVKIAFLRKFLSSSHPNIQVIQPAEA
ncbi:hypothetical protein CC78DRAFT_556655 [Lojkania enalia]|uniref:Hsp70 family protein n=1 Tax=Lojkania enalia TaxID=147567 RepID=A0A9P4JX19_9PLEO|nr:hypothetical protein CC78DRAFT_556655 [Didymosphaeria enalia]